MTEIQNQEFDVVLDDESTGESTVDSDSSDDETENDSGETKDAPKRSPKSNFKKLAKSNKEKDRRIKDLERRLAKLENGTEEDDFEDDSYESGIDNNEFRFFLLENPEAKDYRGQMEAVLEKYSDISLEDALELAKAKTPRQSQSKSDFSTKTVNKPAKKLSDLSEDELYDAKANWKIDRTTFLKEGRRRGLFK